MTRLLQNAYLFKTFTNTEMDGVSALGETATYGDGDQIFPQGDPALSMFFIKYGSVRIRRSTRAGDNVDIALLSAGSHFGEMSFVDNEPRSANAVVLEHTELIEVPYERLRTFLNEHPSAALKFYHELSHYLCARLRATTDDLSFAREKTCTIRKGAPMQFTTILGLLVAVGGILAGNAIEGGSTGSLFQLTAAMIVFLGTLGAVMISHRREDLRAAVKSLRTVFRDTGTEARARLAQRTIDNAQVARRDSLLALEKALGSFDDPFMRSIYRFVIDGVDVKVLRHLFEEEIQVGERRKMQAVKVWSDAGGFAPTIGIIGAVLGLISVMANISDTAKLGQGIAVAFVATVYGVGSANLFFLPISNKLKNLIKYRSETERMVLEGALAIAGGMNAYLVEQKVRAFTGEIATT